MELLVIFYYETNRNFKSVNRIWSFFFSFHMHYKCWSLLSIKLIIFLSSVKGWNSFPYTTIVILVCHLLFFAIFPLFLSLSLYFLISTIFHWDQPSRVFLVFIASWIALAFNNGHFFIANINDIISMYRILILIISKNHQHYSCFYSSNSVIIDFILSCIPHSASNNTCILWMPTSHSTPCTVYIWWPIRMLYKFLVTRR